jgi:hypothetical protein
MNKDDSEGSENMIKAKIVQATVQEEETFPFKKFIQYRISLVSNFKKWELKKRYKCFEQLHSELSKKVKNLPKFPEKKLFNMTESTISERKHLLEQYLNFILNKLYLNEFPIILEFINIEKEELTVLLRSCSSEEVKKDNRGRYKPRRSRSFIELKDDFFKNLEESNNPILVLEEFLNDLEEKSEEKCIIINNFWGYLQNQKRWPKFKREDILKLFFGNGNKLKGVLFHCGNFEENDLGAEKCIQFLANLLKFEFNPEREFYVNILKMANLEHLQNMNLTAHVKSKKYNKECFQILSVVLNEEKGITFRKLINDKETEESFVNWHKLNEII